MLLIVLIVLILAPIQTPPVRAQPTVVDVCPFTGIQATTDPRPAGVILTAFDKRNLWAVNLDQKTRYPLEDTRLCGTNCHLSPDAKWITYLNPTDAVFSKMRLDGAQRTPLIDGTTEVLWWDDDTLLAWSAEHQAAFLPDTGGEPEPIAYTQGVISIQPGGSWALKLEYNGEGFLRLLKNLGKPELEPLVLGIEAPYFNASAWSRNGRLFAYVSQTAFGAEVFTLNPEVDFATQWTFFADSVRIGGQASSGGLNWSPDGNKLAFWVTPLTGDDPAVDTGEAVIHMVDFETGETRRYCGLSITEHTPQPPRLVWSPDGTHLAFKANPEGDGRGYLLTALNVATGVYIELSEGIHPAADVIAWGLLP